MEFQTFGPHTQKSKKFEIQKVICFYESGETSTPSIGGGSEIWSHGFRKMSETQKDFAELAHMIWWVARPISIGQASRAEIQMRVESKGWRLRQNFYMVVWRHNSFFSFFFGKTQSLLFN